MGTLDELLSDDEYVEHEARRHPAVVIRRAVALALASVAALVAGSLITWADAAEIVDLVLAAFVGVFVLRLAAAFIRWRSERILVTDRRLLAATGLVRRKVTSVPLRRIHRATLSRSGMGRAVGYGDLLLDLGGEGSMVIERLARPKQAYRIVTSLIDEEPAPLREPDESAVDTGPLPRVVL